MAQFKNHVSNRKKNDKNKLITNHWMYQKVKTASSICISTIGNLTLRWLMYLQENMILLLKIFATKQKAKQNKNW